MEAPRLKVVYADDDALMRQGVSRLLAAEGMAVRACASGAEAIALCQQCSPDAVLLDIHMPGIDGVETARRLRSNPVTGTLRLVALTGRGTWDLRKKAMDAGFDEFLSKPIPADALLRALRG
jgi:CheY-like chemotaxis protein